MKTVYIVRDFGGQWEDAWSSPVKAFLDPEVAKDFKETREKSMLKEREEIAQRNEDRDNELHKLYEVDLPENQERIDQLHEEYEDSYDDWVGCEIEEVEMDVTD